MSLKKTSLQSTIGDYWL